MAKKVTKGSKNNIDNRGASAKLKEIDGKVVKPVRYIGQGFNYIAGMYAEGVTLVLDENKRPVQYSKIV
jgi:hypothetical protein